MREMTLAEDAVQHVLRQMALRYEEEFIFNTGGYQQF